MHQVEDVVDQSRRIAAAERILQALKAVSAVVFERDHLAVEQRLAGGQLLCRLRDAGEALGPVLRMTSQQGNASMIDAAKQAIAVEFELVEPLASGRHGGDQGS